MVPRALAHHHPRTSSLLCHEPCDNRAPTDFLHSHYCTTIFGDFYFIWPSCKHTSFLKNKVCLCLFSSYSTAITLVTGGAKVTMVINKMWALHLHPWLLGHLPDDSEWLLYGFQIIIKMYAYNVKLSHSHPQRTHGPQASVEFHLKKQVNPYYGQLKCSIKVCMPSVSFWTQP